MATRLAASTRRTVSALFENTTGGDNTATGQWALLINTTGNDNTANGAFAIFNNTTGVSGNTANGAEALFSNIPACKTRPPVVKPSITIEPLTAYPAATIRLTVLRRFFTTVTAPTTQPSVHPPSFLTRPAARTRR